MNVSLQPVLEVPGYVMASGYSLCAIGQHQERNECDWRSRDCYASPWCWGMNQWRVVDFNFGVIQ